MLPMRYGTDVDNAIREAVAAGMRFSDAFRKLKAGTLPGLAGPVGMAERTFSYKWSAGKRAQRQAAESEPSGQSILTKAAAVGMRREGISDPAEVAKVLEVKPELVRGGGTGTTSANGNSLAPVASRSSTRSSARRSGGARR